MVDGDPIDLGPKILLGALHQSPCQIFQVFILGAVLGRDDEAELVTVTVRALEECLAVGAVTLGVIEFAGRALEGDAVALDVAEVETRRVEPVPGHLDDAGLDDDATDTKSGVAVSARQHAADARAATDAVAPESAPGFWASSAWPAANQRDGPEHALEIALGALAGTARADASKPRYDFVVVMRHGRSDRLASVCP
jgi:hypothetical protein